MRLPRVRFTVRRMMVAVAVLALALDYVQVSRWWAINQEMWELVCNLSAGAHQIEETRYRGVAVGLPGGCRGLPVPPYCHKPDAGRAAHHARLKREWRSAAARPWLLSRLGWPEPD
jgi:hypothetical protein